MVGNSPRLVVLDALPTNPGDLDWSPLAALGQLTIHEHTLPNQVSERIAGADAVFTNKVKINAENIDAAKDLKYIGEMATGFDNIEVAAAHKRDIVVSNVPAYSSDFTAQSTWALLLELTNHVGHHAAAVHAGRWSQSREFSFWDFPLLELSRKTLVIAGLGTIGTKVAQIGEAFGMRVLAAQLPGRNSSGGNRVALDDALAQADVLSLHLPQNDQTRGLINAERLTLLRPTALVINAARGGLVDEAAVATALSDGRLAGYAADVLSTEPPSPQNPLLHAPNCLITPHLGWASRDARQRLLNTCVQNFAAFQSGKAQNVVEPR